MCEKKNEKNLKSNIVPIFFIIAIGIMVFLILLWVKAIRTEMSQSHEQFKIVENKVNIMADRYFKRAQSEGYLDDATKKELQKNISDLIEEDYSYVSVEGTDIHDRNDKTIYLQVTFEDNIEYPTILLTGKNLSLIK